MSKLKLSVLTACNCSFWRKDAFAINGFNENFVGWGREDSDFASRLMNNGVSRQTIKLYAKAYHLHHDMCSRKELKKNSERLHQAISQKIVYCQNGIDSHLKN